MTQFSNGLNFAALDIGYGETKLAYSNEVGPILESFRSIARRTSRAKQDDDATVFFHARQMVRRVLVGDQAYEVGDDTDLSGNPNAVQALHADYIRTQEYIDCYHAALLAIGAKRIGILVTGLPLYQHTALKDNLERLLKGEHRVNEDLTITVENMAVLRTA